MVTTDSRRPVLVVGAPRSGTTWVGQVLAIAPGARSIHEPDNEANVPLAVKAKRSLGRFPVLAAGERAPREYEELWDAALAGRLQAKTPLWYAAKLLLKGVDRSELRAGFCEPTDATLSTRLRSVAALATPSKRGPSSHRAIVKSINAALALEWIADRFKPNVVVVLRHPFNVIASWLELGWKECNLDRHPLVRDRYIQANAIPSLAEGSGPLARVTWQIGLLNRALELGISAHPNWQVASHEALCRDPLGGFRGLYDALGLHWSNEVKAFLESVNRPGRGTVAHRVASEQPERWRTRLEEAQLQEIRDVLSGFPPPSWPGDFERA